MNSLDLVDSVPARLVEGCDAKAGASQDAALIKLGVALRDLGYRYTAVTPATHARVNGRPGNEWAVDLQGVFGWSRPFQASTMAPEMMDLMYKANIIAPFGQGWRSLVRASTIDDVLLFHSAYPTTQDNAVFLGPDTYRFVAAIHQQLASSDRPVRRAVDIGCGAGPGAIAIALAKPQAEVIAVDINDHALRLAAINAQLAGVGNVSARYGDLLSDTPGPFDLIVSNPPYLVDSAERAYRHGGGELGAALSLAIVESAVQHLSPGGVLLLYTGVAIVGGVDSFRAAAQKLLQAAGFHWNYRELDPDVFGEELCCPAYANTDRIAAVALTAINQFDEGATESYVVAAPEK